MDIVTSISITGGDNGGSISGTILPGSLIIEDDDDVRGGSNGLPVVMVAVGAKGQCSMLIDTDVTIAIAKAAISGVGPGTATVTDDTNSVDLAKDALIDVDIEGDVVQIATIKWKGTNYAA